MQGHVSGEACQSSLPRPVYCFAATSPLRKCPKVAGCSLPHSFRKSLDLAASLKKRPHGGHAVLVPSPLPSFAGPSVCSFDYDPLSAIRSQAALRSLLQCLGMAAAASVFLHPVSILGSGEAGLMVSSSSSSSFSLSPLIYALLLCCFNGLA